MPFGQSIPVAAPVSLVCGIVGGQVAKHVAKKLGCGDAAQQFATEVGHTLTSAATGWAVNAALGVDATGAAVTVAQSLTTGQIHGTLTRRPELFSVFTRS